MRVERKEPLQSKNISVDLTRPRHRAGSACHRGWRIHGRTAGDDKEIGSKRCSHHLTMELSPRKLRLAREKGRSQRINRITEQEYEDKLEIQLTRSSAGRVRSRACRAPPWRRMYVGRADEDSNIRLQYQLLRTSWCNMSS